MTPRRGHAQQGQQGHHFPVNRFPDHHGHQPFRPLPAPVGLPPYHIALDSVIPIDAKAGTLVFHMVGDSGGVKTPVPPGTHRSG